MPGVWLLRADCYEALDRPDEAWQALESGNARFPDQGALRRQQVFLLVRHGLYREARELGEGLLGRPDASKDDAVAISEALRQGGETSEAMTILEAALLQYGDDRDLLVQAARAALDDGQSEERGSLPRAGGDDRSEPRDRSRRGVPPRQRHARRAAHERGGRRPDRRRRASGSGSCSKRRRGTARSRSRTGSIGSASPRTTASRTASRSRGSGSASSSAPSATSRGSRIPRRSAARPSSARSWRPAIRSWAAREPTAPGPPLRSGPRRRWTDRRRSLRRRRRAAGRCHRDRWIDRRADGRGRHVADRSRARCVSVHIEAPGLVAADVADVQVASGITTEVLVTLSDGPAEVTLEVPASATAISDTPAGPPGTLSGTVTERDGKTPVSGARVYVRGSDVEATTGADGQFTIELPSGPWSVSAIRAGYTTANQDVEVAPDETRTIALSVEKTGLVLADLSIRAPRITGGTASVLDERKDASAVTDVIGADQMSKSGDSDAAAALRRVTGLTVIDGKYVYVRGLGDRYSATLLNGSTLPSPEPEKRVVPLDLFPTSLIETITIQKTFSPDRPAEFGGGVVEVKTRSIPEEPVFTIGLSGAWSQGVTGTDRMTGPIGPTDWLGFGKEWRALPPDVQEASDDKPLKAGGIFSKDGYTADELEGFGESIENRWGRFPKTLPPDFGATLSAGRRAKLGELQFGALVGGVYSNAWDVDEGVRTVLSTGTRGSRRRGSRRSRERPTRSGSVAPCHSAWRGKITSSSPPPRSSIARAPGSGTSTRSTIPAAAATAASSPRSGRKRSSASSSSRSTPTSLCSSSTRARPSQSRLSFSRIDASGATCRRRAATCSPRREAGTTSATRASRIGRATSRPISTVPIPKVGHDTKLEVGGDTVDRDRESTTRRFGYGFHGSEGIDLTAPIEDVMVPEQHRRRGGRRPRLPPDRGEHDQLRRLHGEPVARRVLRVGRCRVDAALPYAPRSAVRALAARGVDLRDLRHDERAGEGGARLGRHAPGPDRELRRRAEERSHADAGARRLRPDAFAPRVPRALRGRSSTTTRRAARSTATPISSGPRSTTSISVGSGTRRPAKVSPRDSSTSTSTSRSNRSSRSRRSRVASARSTTRRAPRTSAPSSSSGRGSTSCRRTST